MNWFPSDLVSAQTTSKFCQQKHYERFWPVTNLVKVVPVFEIGSMLLISPIPTPLCLPLTFTINMIRYQICIMNKKKKKILVQAYVFIRYSFLPSKIVYPFRKFNFFFFFFFKRISFKCSVYQVKMHKISKL